MWIRPASLLLTIAMAFSLTLNAANHSRPNIILVMTDDQGWGQMGYYNHPALKTPHLDAMAANGLRLDRFYAGAPNCSPTRATVLTGRSNDAEGRFVAPTCSSDPAPSQPLVGQVCTSVKLFLR